jgi:hypothetical protein
MTSQDGQKCKYLIFIYEILWNKKANIREYCVKRTKKGEE